VKCEKGIREWGEGNKGMRLKRNENKCK